MPRLLFGDFAVEEGVDVEVFDALVKGGVSEEVLDVGEDVVIG